MVTDSFRLAVGTLTALPISPPTTVDRIRAGLAMVLAPIAAAPIGLAVGVVVLLGVAAELAPLVIALLAVGVSVLGSRALHVDGLSDVADGLTASYDPQRSLQVMKSGTSGPAGVAATVVVLGIQAAALAEMISSLTAGWAAVIAAVALCASRSVLVLCCLRQVRPARGDGLGQQMAGSVGLLSAIFAMLVSGVALTWLTWSAGFELWSGPAAMAAAAVVAAIVISKAIHRFGGVTGDVFGACIETAWAAILVVLS